MARLTRSPDNMSLPLDAFLPCSTPELEGALLEVLPVRTGRSVARAILPPEGVC